MSLPDLVVAEIDWTNAIVGAGLSAVVGLLVVVVFQRPLENVVFQIRSKLRFGGSATLDGIWLSHYEYESEEVPGVNLVDEHFIVLRQDGERVKGNEPPTRGRLRLVVGALFRQWSADRDVAGGDEVSAALSRRLPVANRSNRRIRGRSLARVRS